MKRTYSGFLIAIAVFCWASPLAWAQGGASEHLTPELLQSRILGVRDSSEIDEGTKARLIDLYNQSLANLELVRAHRQAEEEYRRAEQVSPIELESVRRLIEQRRTTEPTEDLGITASTSFDELDRIQQEELANLTAVQARLSALDARLEAESERPEHARDRISAARRLVDEAEAQAEVQPASESNPLLSEAGRWAWETRLESLQAEITLLDSELQSHRPRLELLRAERDAAVLSVTRIGARISTLRSALNEQRRTEAEIAMAQATGVLEGEPAEQPAVRALARANLALVELLRTQADELESLTEREARVSPLTIRLSEAFRSTRRKLQLKGSGAPLGLAIREQRRQLPDASEYARDRRELHQSFTTVSLRLLENEDERRSLNDRNSYVEERIEKADAEPLEADAQIDLMALLETRGSLLDRAIANDTAQQRRLSALDDVLRQLEERTIAYDDFLAERLLWVRSTEALNADAVAALPDEIAAYLSPADWLDTARLTARRFRQVPGFLVIIFVVGLLFGRRQRFRAALVECGHDVGHIQRDRMRRTFEALLWTLLLALPGPLVLTALGWALATADGAALFARGVASGLLSSAAFVFLLMWYRILVEPGGVADRHFRWDRPTLEDLRRHFTWLLGLGAPLWFLTESVVGMNPATYGGTIGLMGFTFFVTVITGITLHLAHPTKGPIRHRLEHRPGSDRWRRYFWFPLAIAIPLALTAMALMGFTHTATELYAQVFLSVVLLTVLWVGRAVVLRWLLMTRRRLVYDAKVAAHDAALALRSEGEAQGDEGADVVTPEADLISLDADSRKLLDAGIILAAVLGLARIWGGTLPALGILEDVTLWSRTFIQDGVELVVTTTVADVLLAFLIGIGGYITAMNFPSLIDIILLKRGKATAGGRYAVSTLSRYAIIAIATLLVLGSLGASWSQLSLMAAALSVGIGFGLQEIVANFICGLILLFERPARVGDVITIGDITGTVTKIQIRATTIRDWDRKELVVPNKELITGRMLNWTLSDNVIRLLISVGVAYGSDVERAMALLHDAARETERVLDEPPPMVTFEQFGDSSLNLNLRAFVGNLKDRLPALTELHHAIDQKFRGAGIVIAFPQLDIHAQSGSPLEALSDDTEAP